MSIDDAIQQFRAAAIQKGEFGESTADDHRSHLEMANAWRELLSQGDVGRDAFKRLLTDDSGWVRGWVAAQLLSVGDWDAVPVLEELARRDGLCGFSARTTLSQWRASRLSSPFS